MAKKQMGSKGAMPAGKPMGGAMNPARPDHKAPTPVSMMRDAKKGQGPKKGK